MAEEKVFYRLKTHVARPNGRRVMELKVIWRGRELWFMGRGQTKAEALTEIRGKVLAADPDLSAALGGELQESF
jgi:6-phosphogluconolactonase/glucosamine-6-phosphate isomerase/deaminase